MKWGWTIAKEYVMKQLNLVNTGDISPPFASIQDWSFLPWNFLPETLSEQSRLHSRLKLPALKLRTRDPLWAVSPPFKWLTPLSHLVTKSNYSVSHLIFAWALINTSQTSARYPTFTYWLSIASALFLILRVASPLPVLLSVLGLTTPIYAYLESPPTTSTDYREFKIV